MALDLSKPGRLRRFLGWPLLTLMAVTAFILGYAGFASALGDSQSVLDYAYLSLQLFTVNSGGAAGPSPPLALEVARFMAPVATAYALGRTLLGVFREQIDQWRLRRSHGHVVVIGLGWLGMALVERLVDQGHSVVALSDAADDETAAAMRRLRVPLVFGDAGQPSVLAEAQVAQASHVVVLAGGDETNAEVAMTVSRIVGYQSDGSLVCLAHVRDPRLCLMLRGKALAATGGDGLRLEFFNVAEEAAAIILDEHAAFLVEDRPARIGVIGDNDVAAAVISEASRLRRFRSEDPIGIVLAGPAELPRTIGRRYPHLERSAAIEVVPGPPEPLEPESIEKLAQCGVVVVGMDDDSTAIAVTLDVADRIKPVPVVVSLGAWSGLAGMLADGPDGKSNIEPFLVFDRLLGTDLLQAGIVEKLARLVHTTFLEERRQQPVDPAHASLVEWRDLSEAYRESSRAQAASLGDKLRSIGCGLVPLADWEAPEAQLADAEIDTLAVLEHNRFVAERKAAGWRLGPPDRDAHTDPYLVPWDQLEGLEGGEDVRKVNRAAARAIPALLARAGYRMVRVGDPPTDLRP